MKDINEIRKFPAWISFAYDIVNENEWHSFSDFRKLFGAKYCDCNHLTSFIKLYSILLGKNGMLNIYESLELIDKVFLDEKVDIGNRFFHLFCDGAFSAWGTDVSYTNVIIATLKFEWLSIDDNMLKSLISDGFANDRVGAKRIVQYLAKLDDNQIQERYLSEYAHLLTAEGLEQFSEMDYGVCSVLVMINPSLANCVAIWQQSHGFQKGILESLNLCRNNSLLSNDLAYTVLDNSMYDFAAELFVLWGESIITIFLEYLLQLRCLQHQNRQSMFELCKSHSRIAVMCFEKQYDQLSEKQIGTLLSIMNPYSDKIALNPLVSAFRAMNTSDMDKKQRDELADFYLPLILRSNRAFPNDIVSFAVTNVHDRLETLTYPDDKWNKLKSLLPEASWLSQWDKCKRVRKAIKKKGYRIKRIEAYPDDELDIHLL